MNEALGKSTRMRFLSAVELSGLRRMVLLGLTAVVSACSDGYPQNESRAVSPITMSQEQRISGMNAIGKRYYLEKRWRYKLNSNCELKITAGEWLDRSHSAWIPLKTVRVVKSLDKSDKSHDVFLESVRSSPSNTVSIPLMEGVNWSDTVEFMSLIQYARRDCLQTDGESD